MDGFCSFCLDYMIEHYNYSTKVGRLAAASSKQLTLPAVLVCLSCCLVFFGLK